MVKSVRRKEFYRILPKIFAGLFLIVIIIAWNDTSAGTNVIFPKSLEGYINFIMTLTMIGVLVNDCVALVSNHRTNNPILYKSNRYKLLNITEFIFSARTQNEIFLSIISDWDEEIFDALSKGENHRFLGIHLRNLYAFLLAIWMKSPIGDLIEFAIKIAKP